MLWESKCNPPSPLLVQTLLPCEVQMNEEDEIFMRLLSSFPLSSLCSPCKFNELNTHPASAFLKFSVVFISIDRWRASLSPHGPMSVSQQRRTYPSPGPSTVNWYQVRVNPLNPNNDQHLISPNSNDAELVIKIMRIKDMIANPRSFDC